MSTYKLLAIEDNQPLGDIICKAASDLGFEVRNANGKTAIMTYDLFRPQIIVLDILMPFMDGVEFMQFLEEKASDTRIIILSGSGDTYRKIAENFGASSGLKIEANIPKPFRISEIKAAFEKIKTSLDAEKPKGLYYV